MKIIVLLLKKLVAFAAKLQYYSVQYYILVPDKIRIIIIKYIVGIFVLLKRNLLFYFKH